jgi:colicin import membrane protein
MTASGAVTKVDIVRSSGNDIFDNSAKAAVLKASPLPVPSDTAILSELNSFQWRFRPED